MATKKKPTPEIKVWGGKRAGAGRKPSTGDIETAPCAGKKIFIWCPQPLYNDIQTAANKNTSGNLSEEIRATLYKHYQNK